MQLQELTSRLNKCIGTLRAEVENETKASFSDIKNILCERVLLEPVKYALKLKELRSLNAAEKRNYPAIDLADDKAKVSIQVTATAESEKIKNTLDKFREHNLYKKYDRILVLILTKKKNYKADFSKHIQGHFNFSPKDDIIDLSDLYNNLVNISDNIVLKKVLSSLESNLHGTSFLDSLKEEKEYYDIIHVNLLPLQIPKNIYLSKLTLDKEEIKSYKLNRKLRSDADYLKAALLNSDSDYPRDFICRENSLLSFHNPDDFDIYNLGLIDEGTTEFYKAKEYYSLSIDYENNFRHLLRKNLQYLLMEDNISWQHEERIFFFSPSNDEDNIREEAWIGQKHADRQVFKVLPSKGEKSSKVYKHFGFVADFKLIDDVWYLLVEPKWLFTWNKYNKSFAHPKLAKETAANERNAQIYHHTRFISWYLSNKNSENGNTLKIDKNIVVKAKSMIIDKEWKN